jgi:hypothetical protein
LDAADDLSCSRAQRTAQRCLRDDTGAVWRQLVAVRRTKKPRRELNSKGTLIVDLMDKLTDAERQQLMRAGLELCNGANSGGGVGAERC